jgi:cytochrome c oxidase subunit 1
MTLWLVSMTLFIASSLLGGLNYVATILNLRTKGMKMTRLPLTIWAILITAVLGVLSFPVLLSAALLLLMDRSMGTSFYLSDIHVAGEALDHMGGSPVLFQHLFWFLGHPEVYIVLLPALGITSEIISTNSRKPIFGYRAMIGSILAIGFLSFIVWGHHGHEPLPGQCLRGHHLADRHPERREGVQLHHHAVARQHHLHAGHALQHWSGGDLHRGWSDRYHSGG